MDSFVKILQIKGGKTWLYQTLVDFVFQLIMTTGLYQKKVLQRFYDMAYHFGNV